MDALTHLLDGVRARGALFSQSILTPPWSIRFAHGAPLTLASMVRGDAWLIPHSGEPLHLAEGSVAIVNGPNPHTIANHPDTDPTCIVTSATTCTTPDGTDISEETSLGTRTFGCDRDGPDLLLSGSYEAAGEVSQRLLSTLPEAVVVPADEYHSPLAQLVAEEIACDEPGQQAVLDRLLDLVLISALRHWFSSTHTHDAAWYTAYSDPVVGHALRLIHAKAAHDWTVESLAKECGVSRPALARRFTELVGQSPKAYLTQWRMALAADLLRNSDATVGSIARQVGYGSTFALSVAFKRHHQLAPSDYRNGVKSTEMAR